ncbi:integrase domain-containing protein [Vibrio cholerae]|uniref:integrase domain-containing protein n=1 Tax=Vibrio cholerae TaxID=666 RepID=UPI0002C17760|nr:integrase domain-containing protein [Vibrio cholerae]EII2379223.1 integrase domain-containing protein [Vibrio cholerae]EJL6524633.1 integrase domain-containing protein [Vibrio cholerae]EJL6916559.1 integrase domain-containing protein [Vibrio cholerae]ELH4197505.1 integrase domain-containing protein [Vibrio cholerae]EMC8146623.1 integrase domain-containing protein [Vibrio cholerae]
MRSERANPDARNFGLQSRDMSKAGLNALKEGMKSFQSIATIHDRWRVFSTWIKSEQGIKDMRDIEKAHLVAYAAHLNDRYERGEIAPSTAQNYLSAVNRVMEIARGDRQVRVDPVAEGGLPKRSGIASDDRSVSEVAHSVAMGAASERLGALLELQRNFGLRFEESAKLDAVKALREAEKIGSVSVKDGTKGGRARTVPITNAAQVSALQRATSVQDGRSMIPVDQSYREFRQEAYREIGCHPVNFHGERHHYAQTRYRELLGAECPIKAGVKHGGAHHEYLAKALGISVEQARILDKEIRAEVARELGHGRIDVTNSYLG